MNYTHHFESWITSAGDDAVADDISPALLMDFVSDIASATISPSVASAASSAAVSAEGITLSTVKG